jgi:hypothetical protein
MHHCHVNSTTVRHAERVLGLIQRPQRAGSRVTTEAYPYGAGPAPDAWPLPAGAFTHPRTAGTFGRSLRLLTRDGGPLELAEALARCSLGLAGLLAGRVPAMRRKGRAAADLRRRLPRPHRRLPRRPHHISTACRSVSGVA